MNAAPTQEKVALTPAQIAAKFDAFQKAAASRPYLEAELKRLKDESAAHEKSLNENLAKLGFNPAVHGDAEQFLTNYILQVEAWLAQHEPTLRTIAGVMR